MWWLKETKASRNYVILKFQLDLEFQKTVWNGQLPMEFWDCGIADKVSKVFIFENAYLRVTFGKSFIFCIFMRTNLFLVFKITLRRQKSVILMF